LLVKHGLFAIPISSCPIGLVEEKKAPGTPGPYLWEIHQEKKLLPCRLFGGSYTLYMGIATIACEVSEKVVLETPSFCVFFLAVQDRGLQEQTL
jgi:hypothetical protein